MFLCIGDIDVDLLIQVDKLPTRDSKVNGKLAQRAPGGMAGNVAVALARLGAEVRVLGRVGDDSEADFVVRSLENSGVDARHVLRMPDVATFTCVSLLAPDGEKSLIKLMTPAYRPAVEDLTDRVCEGVSHIHLTSIGDAALCRRIGEIKRASGVSASLDIERSDCCADAAVLADCVGDFDIVLCNAESRSYVDFVLGRSLAELACVVVTTQGADGARVEAGGLTHQSPGFAVQALDTTGAGDCFAAACLYARLAMKREWPDALKFANCAAALSTTGLGAQSAAPSVAEILSRLCS
jgi:ribokinase